MCHVRRTHPEWRPDRRRATAAAGPVRFEQQPLFHAEYISVSGHFAFQRQQRGQAEGVQRGLPQSVSADGRLYVDDGVPVIVLRGRK